MFKRTTIAVATAAVLGLVIGMEVSSVVSNAAEPAKPMVTPSPKMAPLPTPPAALQLNETQQLHMRIQQLQTQVGQLNSDLAALRSRYENHTHRLSNVGYVGTQFVQSLNGAILGGGGANVGVVTIHSGPYQTSGVVTGKPSN